MNQNRRFFVVGSHLVEKGLQSAANADPSTQAKGILGVRREDGVECFCVMGHIVNAFVDAGITHRRWLSMDDALGTKAVLEDDLENNSIKSTWLGRTKPEQVALYDFKTSFHTPTSVSKHQGGSPQLYVPVEHLPDPYKGFLDDWKFLWAISARETGYVSIAALNDNTDMPGPEIARYALSHGVYGMVFQ